MKSQIVIKKKIYNRAGQARCQVSAEDIEFQLTGSSNLLLCFGHQVKTLQRKAGPTQLCPEFSKHDELSLEKELSVWPYHAELGFSVFFLSFFLIIFFKGLLNHVAYQENMFLGQDLKATEHTSDNIEIRLVLKSEIQAAYPGGL